ncbi:MAG: DUF1501 domain-containing protein [Planctomycetales bacterium]|nr:DUF1501 domain-containing protein [Planctomycetales bacterium]
MLTLASSRTDRTCNGLSRREFMQVGALGLGGLTLPWLMSMQAQAAAAGIPTKDKSVVLLFCSGGPSHIETFDPKMLAPSDVRSMTGEVTTSVPGITFGGTFENLSRHAHRMAIIRSFAHKTGDHVKAIEQVMQCGNPMKSGMGAVVSRLRGTSHPETGMPTHVHLFTDEVDGQYNNEKNRMLNADGPGSLGAAFTPFYPGGKGDVNRNMQLGIPLARLDERRTLKDSLDRLQRDIDTRGLMEGLDKFEQQAFDLILGKSREAFDLSREDPALVRRYDTSRFQTGHKKHRPSELGKQLLLARRLCEAGCGFVTVQNPGWDMHADGNNPGIEVGMDMLGRPVDQAVSVFLEDLADRGLSDRVLFIITGDFGRTPKVNKRGGRDHWPNLSTLAFAGGGLKLGQAIGQSAPKLDVPASQPVGLENLMATVIHSLFDVGQLRLQSNIPRDIAAVLERAEPIPGLV